LLLKSEERQKTHRPKPNWGSLQIPLDSAGDQPLHSGLLILAIPSYSPLTVTYKPCHLLEHKYI